MSHKVHLWIKWKNGKACGMLRHPGSDHYSFPQAASENIEDVTCIKCIAWHERMKKLNKAVQPRIHDIKNDYRYY